ncbi:hypothetical protein XENTR_v10013830 [Xenopus tropicalis]|nr:hypothetical protein XENTR_v10013830 [Xenopus tropicalis]
MYPIALYCGVAASGTGPGLPVPVNHFLHTITLEVVSPAVMFSKCVSHYRLWMQQNCSGFDLLEEAAELVLEYVDTLLGKGHQYFGIQAPLSAMTQSIWFPYSAVDLLQLALGKNENNQHNQVVSSLLPSLFRINLILISYYSHIGHLCSGYKQSMLIYSQLFCFMNLFNCPVPCAFLGR